MALVEINGARLFVEEVGTGPPALVMHGGLGLDHHPYRSLDPLADTLRLVYYDHRGNGRSDGSLESMTMHQWAADGAELARVVADDGRVIVIGHSYGGFVAQELMIAHPDRVSAAVLVATTPGQLGAGEEPAPDGPPIPDEFAAMLADLPDTDADYAVAIDRLAPAYLHRAPVAPLRSKLSDVTFRAAAMRRGFEELAEWSSVDRLAHVEIPVLLVVGRHDAFTAWPQSERIAANLPDAELAILEHSGHFPWLEEPDEFFELVTGWLERRSLI